jgi:RNA polymerase subunit RPABC4/transcription elongation factor Spt4
MDFINVKALKGEEGTGFEKRGNMGPFACYNCEYFVGGNACNQEDMKKLSRQPRWPNGTVVVTGPDCCEYIERVGKFWR